MGLFSKKKNDAQENKPAENTASNISDEMKIILEAREEDKQDKIARAEERQQAQEELVKSSDEIDEQARMAAAKILNEDTVPEGMTFFICCDEIPMDAAPQTEGNLIVRGNLRGSVKAGSEVFLYQGYGNKFSVKIEKIKNDDREYVDEASDERVELEITRGNIPLPTNPDEDASSPIMKFAILTDSAGVENMDDPSCRGMANLGNPRTIAMLCEYGKYGKNPVFFGSTMDCLMTTEFVTIAKISKAANGKSTVGFISVTPKNGSNASLLPVFTDFKLARKAMERGFGKEGGPDKCLALNFAQVAAISRDEHHQGFLVNPGGPVTITIPTPLINDMVKTVIFKKRFGEGAADNPSRALGGSGNKALDQFLASGGPNVQRIVISNPVNTPEFLAIENSVKTYCGAHANIGKLLILICAPADNRDDKAYMCIVDCPEDAFAAECKGIAEAMKPHMKSIRKIQFQLFSKMNNAGMPEKIQWLYSKLPI